MSEEIVAEPLIVKLDNVTPEAKINTPLADIKAPAPRAFALPKINCEAFSTVLPE